MAFDDTFMLDDVAYSLRLVYVRPQVCHHLQRT